MNSLIPSCALRRRISSANATARIGIIRTGCPAKKPMVSSAFDALPNHIASQQDCEEPIRKEKHPNKSLPSLLTWLVVQDDAESQEPEDVRAHEPKYRISFAVRRRCNDENHERNGQRTYHEPGNGERVSPPHC